MRRYASEKRSAYAKRAAAEPHAARELGPTPPRLRATSASTTAPEARRSVVKLAASAWPPASAARHSSELSAKASIASAVSAAVSN
jgi:hypothetical protein